MVTTAQVQKEAADFCRAFLHILSSVKHLFEYQLGAPNGRDRLRPDPQQLAMTSFIAEVEINCLVLIFRLCLAEGHLLQEAFVKFNRPSSLCLRAARRIAPLICQFLR
mmetsp:Transcript_51073/g.90196  ORF Transcript_51073/g.90196 Transcript_51073/m.90196 type:complete len:108 (-) Transcript_51073:430-753(-)